MKKFKQIMLMAGVSLALAFSGGRVVAQGQGQGQGFGGGGGGFGGGGGGGGGGMANFDPSVIFQGMVDMQRDSLSVTNDDEWKVISQKLLKVVQLQMQARMVGMGSMMGGARGGGGGGMRRLGMLGGEPDPSEADLQKALDDHAPNAVIKTAMAKVRAARQQKKDEMTKAQSDLRDLLTPRQEAVLLAGGMLE
jgi:hypothetical protein